MKTKMNEEEARLRRNAKAREDYAKNPEKYADKCRKWRLTHREKFNEICKAWRDSNRERYNEYHRMYCLRKKMENMKCAQDMNGGEQ